MGPLTTIGLLAVAAVSVSLATRQAIAAQVDGQPPPTAPSAPPAAPVQPLAPPVDAPPPAGATAPPPGVVPVPVTTTGPIEAPPAAPAPAPEEPFYRRRWFWGVAGVVALTAVFVVVVAATSSGPPGVPSTTFGDMRAF